MGIPTSLHGIAAAVVICSLLFVDEAGMPLPIAPNEVVLVVAGLLVAGGALAPLVFLPAAVASMTAGMVTGYGWARGLGPAGLTALANKLGAHEQYQRAHHRLQRARPLGIAIARLVPGVRAYSTLVAGAAEVGLGRFMVGALPALLIWLAAFTALGYFFGLPLVILLERLRTLAVSGLLSLALAAGVWVAARHLPAAEGEGPLPLLQTRWRVSFALSLDLGIVGSLVCGIDLLVRFPQESVILLLSGAVLIGYLAIARRGAGATVGERLFSVSYRRLPSVRALWQRGSPSQGTGSPQ